MKPPSVVPLSVRHLYCRDYHEVIGMHLYMRDYSMHLDCEWRCTARTQGGRLLDP